MTNTTPVLSKAQRASFLAHLAETANVAASARAAGVSSARIYRERARTDAFRKAWHRALCEGYARLEADLLAEALRPAHGNLKDVTLKSRQMKIRLGMTLLSLHRASVRGAARAALPKTARETSRQVQDRWRARLDTMHKRLSAGDDDAE